MTIRIWITSYDAPEALENCVKSWLKFTSFPLTIFDNYSTKKCREKVLTFKDNPRVQLMLPKDNLGHSYSLKYAKNCKEDRILFSDADIEILDNINEEDFYNCELSGIYIPAFIDPVTKTYTVSRFHTSFLLCNTSLLQKYLLQEIRLPLDNKILRYDTGALLYHNIENKKSFSNAIENKFIHFWGQSSKSHYKFMPEEIQQYIIDCTAHIIRHSFSSKDLKDRFNLLWKKYIKNWKITNAL